MLKRRTKKERKFTVFSIVLQINPENTNQNLSPLYFGKFFWIIKWHIEKLVSQSYSISHKIDLEKFKSGPLLD